MKLFGFKWVKVDEIDKLNTSIDFLTKCNSSMSEEIKSRDIENFRIKEDCNKALADLNHTLKLYDKILNDKDKLKNKNKKLNNAYKQLVKTYEDRSEKYEKLLGDYKTLKDEFDKFKENKFIIKEVKSGKPCKTQTMKIKKSTTTKPAVRKYIKEEMDK